MKKIQYFAEHLQTFTHNLDGLRSFVDLVSPFLDSKTRELMKKHVGNLSPLLLAIKKVHPEFFQKKGISEEKLKKTFDGDIKIIKREKDGKSFIIQITGPQSKDFNIAIDEVSQAKKRIVLLYQNSLISLISAVECFLSQIIKVYFKYIPNAISDKEKSFSYSDLKNFGNVEDARIYLIDKKVNDLMRCSFSDWIDFFKTKLKLSMSYLDPYMDVLIETCERRNLLVHNAGIVNTIYLLKVPLKLRKGIKKGMQIILDRTYLDERINYFEKYCLLIASELWKNLKSDDKLRSEVLMKITYEHLKSQHWFITEGLSFFLMNDMKMPEQARLVGTLNYWLSMKRQKRWNEVRTSVKKEDFLAKGLLFQLAYFSLLEKNDEFFNLLPRALKSEDIKIEELREFPIFQEIRSDVRFSKYELKSETSKEDEVKKTTKNKIASNKTALKISKKIHKEIKNKNIR